MKFKKQIIITVLVLFSAVNFMYGQQKPTLYIIGDSTVKTGAGKGEDSLWGWGSFINTHFDINRINIQNQAMAGRSSRTFINEGRWDKVLAVLKKGDFVMIQFGHNDSSPINDTLRARGTLPGIGNDSVQIHNFITKKDETVYSYGWYMRKYVTQTTAKGASVIICSPIPRDSFQPDGKINKDKYAAWAKEVAAETGACFIPLNDLIIEAYEKTGPEIVKTYFSKDHTHTNRAGAIINARLVVQGLKQIKDCKLNDYLKK